MDLGRTDRASELKLENREIELLANLNEVGIGDVVGLGDFGVFVGVAVEALRDFGEVVA